MFGRILARLKRAWFRYRHYGAPDFTPEQKQLLKDKGIEI